jgi:carbon monoxide dehydrogenase subunit G
MPFEITKTFVVKALPAEVWAFLVDPQRVARCMPGAAITDKLAENTYAGTMTVKVGPVQASYRGKVVFERLDAASRTADIVATGQDVRGKGGADLRLRSSLVARGSGETEVTAVSLVNVTGILAQMGRGMVEDVGDQMFQIFSQRMRTELEATATATANPTATSSPTANPTANTTAPTPSPSPPRRASAGAQGKASATANPTANPSSTASSPRPSPPLHGGEGDQGRATALSAAEALPPPGRGRAGERVEALDVGALGARVARRAAARALTTPTPLWVSLLLAATVLYLLFRSKEGP